MMAESNNQFQSMALDKKGHRTVDVWWKASKIPKDIPTYSYVEFYMNSYQGTFSRLQKLNGKRSHANMSVSKDKADPGENSLVRQIVSVVSAGVISSILETG